MLPATLLDVDSPSSEWRDREISAANRLVYSRGGEREQLRKAGLRCGTFAFLRRGRLMLPLR